MRIILILIAVVGILFIVRHFLSGRPSDSTPAPHRNSKTPDILTECRHCGLHLPASEAIHQGDDSFCCIEHLNEHQQ